MSESKSVNHNAKANWLRASVLGASDGIVSVSGVVVGVASATSSISVIFIAGIASVLAGALSMASGEFVSVSTQRDIEQMLHEKHSHKEDEGEFTNPWHAALASAVAFTIGSLIPIATIMLSPEPYRIITTFLSVIAALAITGYWSAKLSGTPKPRAIVRVTIGGIIAMIATYGIGSLFSVSI